MQAKTSIVLRCLTSFSLAVLLSPTLTSSSWASETPQLYTYTFTGQAMNAGQPCPKAKIVIRLDWSQSFRVKTVRTDADGRYTVSFKVRTVENEGVLWRIEASQTHLPTGVQLEGQRISLQDEDIHIDRSIEFAQIPTETSDSAVN